MVHLFVHRVMYTIRTSRQSDKHNLGVEHSISPQKTLKTAAVFEQKASAQG